MRLENKIALVTGAAHGIGRAIAERFATEGANVFLADVDTAAGEKSAQEIVRAGGKAVFVSCDVSDATAVRDLIRRATQGSGRIDVLCNNAAYISKEWHNSAEAPDEEWERSYRVSLLGSQLCCREVLPFMVKQKGGSIVNISSVQGLVAGCNSAAYTTVKHALIGLTRSVACDYGIHNVRCNALCPGAVATRISPAPGSELHQRQLGKTFLNRVGEPREIAAAALFLASHEASYITGAVLAVDGGWTAI